MKPSRSRDVREPQRVLDAGGVALAQPRRLQAAEVVGRALALAARGQATTVR